MPSGGGTERWMPAFWAWLRRRRADIPCPSGGCPGCSARHHLRKASVDEVPVAIIPRPTDPVPRAQFDHPSLGQVEPVAQPPRRVDPGPLPVRNSGPSCPPW